MENNKPLFTEIGHIANRVKDYPAMHEFVESAGCVKSFILTNDEGEERIGYFRLPDGHFLELFPRTTMNPHPFYGDNDPAERSFQLGILSENPEEEVVDPQNSRWLLGKDKKAEKLAGVSYNCKDYENMKKFYREIMRLSPVSEDETKTVFVLPSGQTITLVNIPYTGDNNTVDRAYHHIALLTEDIGAVSDWLESNDIALSHGSKKNNPVYSEPYRSFMKPGHDNSYAFYFSDPEDNDFEVMMYTENSLQQKI